jgi:glycosidase
MRAQLNTTSDLGTSQSGGGPAVTTRKSGAARPVQGTGGAAAPVAIESSRFWTQMRGDAKPPQEAKFDAFWCPNTDSTGLTTFFWQPKKPLTFETRVKVKGDWRQVQPLLISNANRPELGNDGSAFHGVEMKLDPADGVKETSPGEYLLHFKVEVPIEKLGNYRATVLMSTKRDGEGRPDYSDPTWLGHDIYFRPKPQWVKGMNLRQIPVGHVNAEWNTKQFSTFADLTESVKPDSPIVPYNLDELKQQGANALWVMCPYFTTRWKELDNIPWIQDAKVPGPECDAGSQFAPRDFFSVDPRLTRASKLLPPDTDEETKRKADLAEFMKFVKEARKRGQKVILDIPVNHVGHEFIFRDLINGEVKKFDFSLIANAEQLAQVKANLQNPAIEKYAQQLAPFMFGALGPDGNPLPDGAIEPSKIAFGGWGKKWWAKWTDTDQLNIRSRIWTDIIGNEHADYFPAPNIQALWHQTSDSATQQRVNDWLGRVLEFWATLKDEDGNDCGVDGFRLDHGQAPGAYFWFDVVNKLQSRVKEKTGRDLFVMPEDHDTLMFTREVADLVQTNRKSYDFVDGIDQGNLDKYWSAVEDPLYPQLFGGRCHDDDRIATSFSSDFARMKRYHAAALLSDVPYAALAGDEFAETIFPKPLMMQYKPISVLELRRHHQSSPEQDAMHEVFCQAGSIREQLVPGVHARLHCDWPERIVAWSRETTAGMPLLVFVNGKMENDAAYGKFKLDAHSKSLLDDGARYKVVDLMSEDPTKHLWTDYPEGLTGAQLKSDQLPVVLEPKQVQALTFVKI